METSWPSLEHWFLRWLTSEDKRGKGRERGEKRSQHAKKTVDTVGMEKDAHRTVVGRVNRHDKLLL
jgi:hypothetical protein